MTIHHDKHHAAYVQNLNDALSAHEDLLQMDINDLISDLEKIPEDIAKVAVRAAQVLNLQVAGVDIGIEEKTQKVFLIEVNRGPGVTYDTSVSPELSEIAKFLDSESS